VGSEECPRRCGEIRRGLLAGRADTLEIAPRVLSRELGTLICMDVVERKDHEQIPFKVEYRLTRKGRSLLPIIDVMHKWGRRHLA